MLTYNDELYKSCRHIVSFLMFLYEISSISMYDILYETRNYATNRY